MFQRNVGFFININYPWFGFSADGLLQDGEKTILIEIKSPTLGEKTSGIDLWQLLPYLKEENGALVLKKKHSYYGQIQLGLFLYGLEVCKLCIFCQCNSSVLKINVPFDVTFCKEMVCCLSEINFKDFLPYLFGTRKNTIAKGLQHIQSL